LKWAADEELLLMFLISYQFRDWEGVDGLGE
jgi:hypothetical protein